MIILYLLLFLHVGQEVLRERLKSLLQLTSIVKLLTFILKPQNRQKSQILDQLLLDSHKQTFTTL